MELAPTAIPSKDGFRHVLLIGGGHANVQVLEILAKSLKKSDRIRITMVSAYQYSYYSGMLPGCIARFYTAEDIRMDVAGLCKYYGAKFVLGRVAELCPQRKIVTLEDGSEISFDIATLNIGSITKGSDVFHDNGSNVILTRPISELLDKIQRFENAKLAGVDEGNKLPSMNVVVGGGGAAGIELALAFRARYRKLAQQLQVTVISAKDVITPHMGRRVKSNIDDKMKELNVLLRQNAECVRINLADPAHPAVVLSDETEVPFDLLMMATGAAPPALLSKCRLLEKDDAGFLKVQRTLQTPTHPFIFGGGDCVSVDSAPWISKAGVYAVREGPILAKNIMSFIRGTPLEEYEPQTGFLALLMTGDGEAISSWKGMSMSNSFMWKLKHKIDTGFMTRFTVAKMPPKPDWDYLKL